MLVDLSQAVGSYLHDVFIAKFQWWVLLGYVAQIMFTMRFVVQWIASERAGKMVMPIAFWFFSIGGGMLLLLMRSTSVTPSSSWARRSGCSSTGAISISSCATGTRRQKLRDPPALMQLPMR